MAPEASAKELKLLTSLASGKKTFKQVAEDVCELDVRCHLQHMLKSKANTQDNVSRTRGLALSHYRSYLWCNTLASPHIIVVPEGGGGNVPRNVSRAKKH